MNTEPQPKPSTKPSMTEVWVLLYEHKHGCDISVYASEDLAVSAVWAIMADWTDSAREPGLGALKRLKAAGEVSKAIDLWADVMNEHFSIDLRRVEGSRR